MSETTGREQSLAQRKRSEWKPGWLPRGGHRAPGGGGGAGEEKQESKEAQGVRKTELSPCNVHSPHCPEVHESQVTVPAIGKVCALAILISQMKTLRPRKQN